MKSKGWEFVNIDNIHDESGTLSVAEFEKHFNFEAKRIFYLSNIKKGEIRGEHAHEVLSQFVLCLAGCFDIELDNGNQKENYTLSNDGVGILLDGLVWRTMSNFSEDSVMLVLCDRVYKQDIVIRSYDDFLKKVNILNDK
jgi:hypothetical protein